MKALNEVQLSSFEYDIEGIQFKTFRTGNKIKVDSIAIEPIHVAHSVPGAYGFIIHTSSGTIIYTGDFRIHGTRPEMTEEFVVKARDATPIALITENTNMIGAEISSEFEVMDKIDRVTKQTPELVLADFSRTDVDRLKCFQQVAEKNGRCLAVTMKQAYLLDKLRQDQKLEIPSLTSGTTLIFQKAKKKYYKWEKDVLKLDNVVDSSNC